MAVQLTDLADQLGVEVVVIRDYITFLDLDVPEDASEISEGNAKLLEGVIKKIRHS